MKVQAQSAALTWEGSHQTQDVESTLLVLFYGNAEHILLHNII